MNDIKSMLPERIKKNQNLLLVGIVLVSIIASTFIILWNEEPSDNISSNDGKSKQKTEKRIEVSKIAKGATAEDRWIQQAELELKSLSKNAEIQNLEKQQMEEKIRNLEEKLKTYEEENNSNTLDSINLDLGKLREEFEDYRKTKNNQFNDGISQQNSDSDFGNKVGIQDYHLKLSNNGKTKPKQHNLENYIPAGSYAPAIIISGADTSVGINSQSEPRPTLFRIIGKAKTALYKNKIQEIDLTGCTVTGAASGDLSSEKGFIRLLKLTCSRDENHVFETEVNGYAADMGRGGIRGEVVSREGDFVAKSFLAGITGGAGSIAAQRFNSPFALPSGLATEQITVGDAAKSGLGRGIEKSSNMLSEYNIKRAEQYQPVIPVPAGLEVELVFIDGVYLGGVELNDNLSSNDKK